MVDKTQNDIKNTAFPVVDIGKTSSKKLAKQVELAIVCELTEQYPMT